MLVGTESFETLFIFMVFDAYLCYNKYLQISWKIDYEPYVVVKRNGLPPYDQRFVGFGWNKVSHVMSLNAAGYFFIYLILLYPKCYLLKYFSVSSFLLFIFYKHTFLIHFRFNFEITCLFVLLIQVL